MVVRLPRQMRIRDGKEDFGRTLAQGSKLLDELLARARASGAEGIAGADAFQLHDTYGFPIDLTLGLVAEHGLGVDEQGFESLMEQQRTRARAGSGRGRGTGELREQALRFAGEAAFTTDFVGYESIERETTVGAVAQENGRVLVKLVESPFYATGGGQVADAGELVCAAEDCRAAVTDVRLRRLQAAQGVNSVKAWILVVAAALELAAVAMLTVGIVHII